MQNKMLSAVADPELRMELLELFRRYPFDEMSADFSRREGCAGITFDDASIFILNNGSGAELLHIYLHEAAHAALRRSGHPRWNLHNDDFIRIAREMQVRFSCARFSNHEYDQQDARLKNSAQQTTARAAEFARLANYDPSQRALHLAIEANNYEMRFAWRKFFIVGLPAAAYIAWPFLPSFEFLTNALEVAREYKPLAAGAVIIATILFLTRNQS